MLNKNFYKLLINRLYGEDSSFKNVTYIDYTGSRAVYNSNSQISGFRSMKFDGFTFANGVEFSSNGAAPTLEDYETIDRISTGVGSAIQFTEPSELFYDISDVGCSVSTTIGITANKPVTIRSLYLKWNIKDAKAAVIDHSLLETPITLQPGESKQITYTIRFNYPQPPAV